MLEVALLVAVFSVKVADLPPGAVLRLGDDRFRAGSGVGGLVLSPDGKQFATWRSSSIGICTVAVWSTETGRPLRSTEVNAELLQDLVWGQGGGLAIVQRAELPRKDALRGKLYPDDFRVWNFADPNAIAPPVLEVSIGFESAPLVLADRQKFGPAYIRYTSSADGRHVAALRHTTTPNDKAASTYAIDVFELKPTDTATKLARVRTLDLGTDGCQDFCLSADAKLVATVTPDSTGTKFRVQAWDTTTGTVSKPLQYSSGARRVPVAISPDRRTLALSPDSNTLLLVDPLTGVQQGEVLEPVDPAVGGSSYRSILFSPDGKRVFLVREDGVSVVDFASKKVVARLEGHSGTVTKVAVAADGSRIATADWAGLIRIWDAVTFRPLHPVTGHRVMVEVAEQSPDGKRLLTWASDETVRIWDLASGKELRSFAGAVWKVSAYPQLRQRPTFTPDGLGVVFNLDQRLVARDVLTGTEIALSGKLADAKPANVVFAPDGKAVLLWRAGEPELSVYDWPSGKQRFAVAAGKSFVEGMPGFSADGSVVFPDATDPERWDAKTGKELPPAWKGDRYLRLYPVRSLRPNPLHLIDESDPLNPESRLIGAGTDIQVPGSKLLHSGENSSDYWYAIWGQAMPPSGRMLASSSRFEPGEISLHEAATGQLRRTFVGHRGVARVLGFTQDGTRLITSGSDHTVLVWDVRPQALPLPRELRLETNAAKLWATMCVGKAEASYLAMARLAAEPGAAVATARMRMKPATAPEASEATRLQDSRAIELLEMLRTPESRDFLRGLAGGDAAAWRTQEAKRAIERLGK